MYFLKFQNYHSIIWFAFVPLFYFMYLNVNKNIKLELYFFSLIQIIMFLYGLFVVKSIIY